MKAILLVLALLAIPAIASAQPFVEVGIGAAVGGCVYQGHRSELVALDKRLRRIDTEISCSRSPLGLFAIGYEFNDRLRIQLDHWSSIPDTRDRGMEILSIRYRYSFK